MLLVIISLLLYCDLLGCVNYEKISFNEESLMKKHHQNSFQIKSFIKEARLRFHEDTPSPPADLTLHKSSTAKKTLDFKTTNIWLDNSSVMAQLGLNTPNPFFHHVRSRPSFPYLMTPYTTELNYRHLKWDKIFTGADLRYGSKVTFAKINRSPPQPKPKLKAQRPSAPKPQPSISKYSSRTFSFNFSTSPKSSLREYLSHVLKTSLLSPYNDHMMWLQEVTAFPPVERWLETLAGRSGVTRGYATHRTTQSTSALPKAQTPVQAKHLKNYSSHQPLRTLHQDHTQSDHRAHDGESRVPAVTTAAFFTVNVSGIIHLRTKSVAVKDERRANGRPGSVADEGGVQETGSAAVEVLDEGHNPNHQARSSRKSRRYKSNSRKRKHYHRSHQGYRHSKYRNDGNSHTRDVEYPMFRRRRKITGARRRFSLNTPSLKGRKQKTRGVISNSVTRRFENMKHRELTHLPTPTPRFLLELEDSKHIKLTEAEDKLGHDRTAQKDKPFVHQESKENSRPAETEEDRRNTRKQNIEEGRETERRWKEKAELIRKIMEGSSYSYSDEEEVLRKNLKGALRYGIRT